MARADVEALKTQIETKKDKAMQELVPYYLPRLTNDEAQEVTVGINGILYKIQRGKNVEIPKAVAEILDNSRRMDDINAAFIENIGKE